MKIGINPLPWVMDSDFNFPLDTPTFDADRLNLVIENLVTVAQIIRAEGIQPCLHPHVGSWIETETEIQAVLDAVDPAALSFGPDPGHLFWANADPVSLITDYRDRVRAAHLKDVHAAAREKSRFEVSDYRQATGKNHVWTELGRGDVDLVGVLKALPDAFGGWLVVEVDVPDLGTPAESTHASARWIRTQPLLQGGLV